MSEQLPENEEAAITADDAIGQELPVQPDLITADGRALNIKASPCSTHHCKYSNAQLGAYALMLKIRE